MEGVTFLDERLQEEFGRFVEIRLHTDGGGDLYESSMRNKALLRERFQTVAIPYYAVLSPDGATVFWHGGGKIDADEFLEHLRLAPRP